MYQFSHIVFKQIANIDSISKIMLFQSLDIDDQSWKKCSICDQLPNKLLCDEDLHNVYTVNYQRITICKRCFDKIEIKTKDLKSMCILKLLIVKDVINSNCYVNDICVPIYKIFVKMLNY